MKAGRITETEHHRGCLILGEFTDGLPTARVERGSWLEVLRYGTSEKVGQVLPNSISYFEKLTCLPKTTDLTMHRP